MTNLDDFINEADEQAPDAVFTNYGKFDWRVKRYIDWRTGQPVEVTAEEYAKLPTKHRGADGKDKNAKGVELVASVDIQEFKPDLTFTYERKFNVGDQDWNAIIKPSLEKALGVKIAKGKPQNDKEISPADALNRIKGQYVAYQDVPQKRNPKYNTIKLVRVFKSRDECVAAMNGTNGSSATSAPSPDLPKGWNDPAAWAKKLKELRVAHAKGESVESLADTWDVDVEFLRKALA